MSGVVRRPKAPAALRLPWVEGTSEAWRAAGWRAVFRGETVLLIQAGRYLAGDEPCMVGPIEGGGWRLRPPGDDGWNHGISCRLADEALGDLARTLLACYCRGADPCDFCAGIRPAPPLPKGP